MVRGRPIFTFLQLRTGCFLIKKGEEATVGIGSKNNKRPIQTLFIVRKTEIPHAKRESDSRKTGFGSRKIGRKSTPKTAAKMKNSDGDRNI